MSMLIAWLILMSIYIAISLYTWKKRSNNLDIVPIFIYNGQAYWEVDKKVYRSKVVDGQIDLDSNEYVDPVNLYDIDQIDYLLITQELEDMNQ